MNQKKSFTSYFTLLGLLPILMTVAIIFAPRVSAAQITCPDGYTVTLPGPVAAAEREEICSQHGSASPSTPSATTGSDELDGWLQAIINLLSAAVGLVVVLSLVFAGIQYTTAGANASQVAAAKGRIAMSILALILFIFTYGILQWLIPGGIF